ARGEPAGRASGAERRPVGGTVIRDQPVSTGGRGGTDAGRAHAPGVALSGRHRVWSIRRAAVRTAALVVSLAVAGAGVLVVLRPHSTAEAASEIVEIHAAHGSSFVPALQGKRPLFILVLGSDARPGQNIERQRA